MPVPLFNIPNYINLFLPPNKRGPKYLAFFQSLCSGLTWRKEIWDAYRNGDPQSVYNPATTYTTDDKVWWNFATYQSLIDGNTGNQPDISPSSWIMRNASFLGATERARIDGKYLKLTKGLNRQFGGVFRQPPYPAPYDFGLGGGTFSDIYITSATPAYVSPLFGSQPNVYGYFGSQPNEIVWGSEPVIAAATSYTQVLHFPIAIHNSLGASDPVRLSVIDKFMRGRLMFGCAYQVVTY